MSDPSPTTSVAANALLAICLPVMLLTFGFSFASAQCSQATLPAAASSAQPAASARNTPPASVSSESSSTAETATARFATGSAVTVLEGTPLQVVNDMPISSRTTKAGAKLSFTVTRDVLVEGILVIPCGATVFGTVVSSKQAGRLTGASHLTLELTALNLGGRTFRLYTPPFKVVGQSKTRPTVNKVTTGAAVGALAMDTRAGLMDMHVKEGPRLLADSAAAGVGAGAGIAIAASSPPSIALIPAESQMEFTLASPIAVFPVDQRTAARLAHGMYHGPGPLCARREPVTRSVTQTQPTAWLLDSGAKS
ncbi:MAG TPA: hypothetical protein VGR47_15135 [Terracidiphilus sp.]|nr:hypothetical protein [Terracidiphilus sp.]